MVPKPRAKQPRFLLLPLVFSPFRHRVTKRLAAGVGRNLADGQQPGVGAARPSF